MEHFRSSGTSGGLIHRRTESGYVKARASEFLRAVGVADAYAIRFGRLREEDVEALKARAAAVVSDSWLERSAGLAAVAAFRSLAPTTPPGDADRAISDLLKARFPEETVRPAHNSRWG